MSDRRFVAKEKNKDGISALKSEIQQSFITECSEKEYRNISIWIATACAQEKPPTV